MVRDRPLCIYHGNCADGFTAAWVVHKAFGGNVDLFAATHGKPPPDCAGRNVIIVDFSYKRAVLESLLQSGDVNQAFTILILDHHKSAAEDLAGLTKPSVFFTANDYRLTADQWRAAWEHQLDWPVRALFDMERSGAQLAWDYFFPGLPRPRLVDYVADRDLWKFNIAGSRVVNSYIAAAEHSIEEWDDLDDLLRKDLGSVCDRGEGIEKKQKKDVADLVAASRREMVIAGHWVPVANVPFMLASDAGHAMLEPYPSPNLQGEMVTPPFSATYWDGPEGRTFSLRSADDRVDVSVIARGYGGGGHRNAAGFRRPLGWEGEPLGIPKMVGEK